MPAETVLDASVAAKCVYVEDGSEAAKAYVASSSRLIAPDLIFAEVTNVAVKSIRRGGADLETALLGLDDLSGLIEEAVATPPLVASALLLAAEFNLSTYDAVYVALAEARGAKLVTADLKLARRLEGTRLESLVAVL